MIVVDASAMVLGLVDASDRARHVRDPSPTSSSTRRTWWRSRSRRRSAGWCLRRLAVRLHRHGNLLGAMWARREDVPMYDAAYVALAARLRVPLLTADRRLGRAPALGAEVEVVAAAG